MDAPQYVYVDEQSDYFCNWMFYHSDMDTQQYEFVDVPSDI